MSRTGSCLDNAVAESWSASLKVELVHRQRYRTRAEARTASFRWIAWYNRFRLHSANNYLPPIQWEHQHHHQPATTDHGRIARCPPPGGGPYWTSPGEIQFAS
jgi:transposase InsO family protein